MAGAGLQFQLGRQRVAGPEIGHGTRHVGGRLAGEGFATPVELLVLGIHIAHIGLHGPGRGQLQAQFGLHAPGILPANQVGYPAVPRVVGGNVAAADVIHRQRGTAAVAPEAELRAQLQHAAGGQPVVGQDLRIVGAGQVAGGRVGGGGVLGIDHGLRGDVPGQPDAAGGGVVAALAVAFDLLLRVQTGEVQLDAFVPQAGEQLQGGCQVGAVLQIEGQVVHTVAVLRHVGGHHARQVVEILGDEVVRIDGAFPVVRGIGRVGGLAVERHVHAEAPVAAVTGNGRVQGGVDAVSEHTVVVALQQGAGAVDLRVGAVEGVFLDVAVVTHRIVPVEGVLHGQRIAEFPVGNRAQPLHALHVQAVGAVVVLVAQPFQHALPAFGGLGDRRAPVGAVVAFVLVLIGQRVGKAAAEVREQRGDDLRAVATVVVDPLATTLVVGVDADVVVFLATAISRNAPVQAEGGLPVAPRAGAQLHFADVVALCGLGDVVDGGTHATGPIQEAGRAADVFHPFVDPGIHWLGGNAVLQVDAVVDLID